MNEIQNVVGEKNSFFNNYIAKKQKDGTYSLKETQRSKTAAPKEEAELAPSHEQTQTYRKNSSYETTEG